MTDTTNKALLTAKLAQAFTPASPVNNGSLFSGRNAQVMSCITALFQAGVHIGVYGERGVGKTSLANILPMVVNNPQLQSMVGVRVDCNTHDTYESLWRRIFRELEGPTRWLVSNGGL